MKVLFHSSSSMEMLYSVKTYEYLIFHGEVCSFPTWSSIAESSFLTSYQYFTTKPPLGAVLWDIWVLLYFYLYIKTSKYTVFSGLIINNNNSWILNPSVLQQHTFLDSISLLKLWPYSRWMAQYISWSQDCSAKSITPYTLYEFSYSVQTLSKPHKLLPFNMNYT